MIITYSANLNHVAALPCKIFDTFLIHGGQWPVFGAIMQFVANLLQQLIWVLTIVLLDHSDCWLNISHSSYHKLAVIISLWDIDLFDVCCSFITVVDFNVVIFNLPFCNLIHSNWNTCWNVILPKNILKHSYFKVCNVSLCIVEYCIFVNRIQ